MLHASDPRSENAPTAKMVNRIVLLATMQYDRIQKQSKIRAVDLYLLRSVANRERGGSYTRVRGFVDSIPFGEPCCATFPLMFSLNARSPPTADDLFVSQHHTVVCSHSIQECGR